MSFTVKKHKLSSTFANHHIIGIFCTAKQDGEIGLEFEWEGENLSRLALDPELTSVWAYHRDDSLDNAKDGCEYTLVKPLGREEAKREIDRLFQKARKVGKFNLSSRCSTHVHVNVQNFTVSQVFLFASLYYLFEDHFFAVNGPKRKGNRFTLALSDSEAIGDWLSNTLKHEHFNDLVSQNNRYSALSWHALQKFGSLEFRSMQGCDDPAAIKVWIDVLMELYDFAKKQKNMTPEDFLGQFSFGTFLEYTMVQFPKTYNYIRFVPDRDNLLNLAVWRVQDFIYSVDWSTSIEANPYKVTSKQANFGKKIFRDNTTNATMVQIVEEAILRHNPPPADRADPDRVARLQQVRAWGEISVNVR